jgi:predicted nucleic-acid-binding protein
MPASWKKRTGNMYAIDTNILVRYLTSDHPEQYAKACEVIESKDIFVSTSVFLECAWVLRRTYGLTSGKVCQAFRSFTGLPGIFVENPPLLAEALDRAEAGMDFADALHLGAAGHCQSMLTFDRSFIKAAAGSSTKVEAP